MKIFFPKINKIPALPCSLYCFVSPVLVWGGSSELFVSDEQLKTNFHCNHTSRLGCLWIHEFVQYYKINKIGFAIVRFVLSIVSCSSDLVLKSGLRNDEKRDFARWLWHINNVLRAVFKMASNFKGAADILPKFWGIQACLEKMTPKKSSLPLKVLLAQKLKEKSTSQKKTGTESIHDWPEVVPMVNRYYFCQKCFFIRISFSDEKSFELTALSLLNLDTLLGTGSQV